MPVISYPISQACYILRLISVGHKISINFDQILDKSLHIGYSEVENC